MPAKQERLHSIEGIRGLAALYVVFQHICTMVDPHMRMMRDGAQPSWLAAAMGPLWFGHLAVAGFIVVSGFCLQLSLYSRGDGRITDLRRFLLRRCERILPPYYACLALSLVVVHLVTKHQKGLPWAQYLPVTGDGLLAHVLLIHNLRPEWMYKINGVLWSISIEFQLYFVFPLLVWVALRWGRLALLAVCTGAAGLLLWNYDPAAKLYVWYLPLFALGIVGARLAFDPARPKLSARFYWGAALVGWLLAAWLIGQTKALWVRDAAGGFAVVAMLIAGALAPRSWPARILSLKPLVWLGLFSYSLYLMHHPVLQIVYVLRPEVVNTPAREFAYLIVVAIPVILATCYGFFLLFEKPFMQGQWSRRLAERGKPAKEPA